MYRAHVYTCALLYQTKQFPHISQSSHKSISRHIRLTFHTIHTCTAPPHKPPHCHVICFHQKPTQLVVCIYILFVWSRSSLCKPWKHTDKWQHIMCVPKQRPSLFQGYALNNLSRHRKSIISKHSAGIVVVHEWMKDKNRHKGDNEYGLKKTGQANICILIIIIILNQNGFFLL